MLLEQVFEGVMVVVEVVVLGQVVWILLNFYGIVIFFGLSLEEIQVIVFIVCVLIGNCLVVVFKILQGDVQLWVILVGNFYISGEKCCGEVDVVEGVEVIMQVMSVCVLVCDICGELGIYVGGMFEWVCKVMVFLIGYEMSVIYIQDLLVVDMFILCKVQGGMVGECVMENVVGMVVMVKVDCL